MKLFLFFHIIHLLNVGWAKIMENNITIDWTKLSNEQKIAWEKELADFIANYANYEPLYKLLDTLGLPQIVILDASHIIRILREARNITCSVKQAITIWHKISEECYSCSWLNLPDDAEILNIIDFHCSEVKTIEFINV